MSLRSQLATFVGKSSYWFLHNIFKGGSSFPGKITTKIDPNILSHFGEQYDVVIVTGTNGKTLTTALIVQTLKEKYDDILTNPTGSNMEQGIVSTFIQNQNKSKKQKKLAVLEVDEANVEKIVKFIKPKYFVLTNIFRDQLDRYGEIYTTYQKILDGIKLAPEAKIIANGDASIFNSKEISNQQIFYGFKNETNNADLKASPNTDGVVCPICHHIMHFREITYGNLGDFFCPNCNFKRPKLNYELTKIDEMTPVSSDFEIDGFPYQIKVGGTYNIYNALAAYSVGREFDISQDQIKNAFQKNERVFGRQEEIKIGDKKITIILVKNPVGLNQVIDLIGKEKNPFSFVGLLNANYADGIDTSWIWDGEFERLNNMNISKFITGGQRYKDITFRLKAAGIPDDKHIIEPDINKVIDQITSLPTKKVYVLATYTAMLQMRKILANKGYIDGGMG